MITSKIVYLTEKKEGEQPETQIVLEQEEGENFPFLSKEETSEAEKTTPSLMINTSGHYTIKEKDKLSPISEAKKQYGRKRANSSPAPLIMRERPKSSQGVRDIDDINIHSVMLHRANRRKSVTPDEDTGMIHKGVEKLSPRSSSLVAKASYAAGRSRPRSCSAPVLPCIRHETPTSKKILTFIGKSSHLQHLLTAPHVNLDNMEDSMLANNRMSPRSMLLAKLNTTPTKKH